MDQAACGKRGYPKMPTQQREIQRWLSNRREGFRLQVPCRFPSSTLSIDSTMSSLAESLLCARALSASNNSGGKRLTLENVPSQHSSESDIIWAESVGVSSSASNTYRPATAVKPEQSLSAVDKGMPTGLGVARPKLHVGTELCQSSSSELSPQISTED